MCRDCANVEARSFPEPIGVQLARMGRAKGTHAMLLYSSALVALAGAVDGDTCRAFKRRSFASLVKISTCFVAEFKAATASDDTRWLTVTIHRKHLLFELFRQARDILTSVHEADSVDDVHWTLERVGYLAKALVNVGTVANGSEWDFQEAEGTLTGLADLLTELCEEQMGETGDMPPDWSANRPADRADRLAMFLYDEAEQIAMERQKRFAESGA